jgi:hypothetical protein
LYPNRRWNQPVIGMMTMFAIMYPVDTQPI